VSSHHPVSCGGTPSPFDPGRSLHVRAGVLLARIAAGAFVVAAFASPARSADANDIAEGMRLFLQKGNCQACHGWAGDGRKTDNQMPDGANLRETALDRDMLLMTIKCGRPGRDMPAYDRLAYSDGRCYGMKQADLRASGLRLPDPPATLQPREIDLIVEFMFAKVIRKGPMDRARCVEFWGAETEACREFR
jgi:Cytochrome C oxidase, cbb3-type, subunit III